MYCPLCKAEFRDGFTHCSDCHTSLVPTKQEADCQTVARVWRGGSKSELESVLTALQQAEIPLLFREHPNVGPAVRAGLLSLLPLGRPHPTYDTEFEIKVMGSDVERALEAVRRATEETEDS